MRKEVMRMEIFNTCGIDTIQKEYLKGMDLKKYGSYVNSEYSILSDKLNLTHDGGMKIAFKPSHYYTWNKGRQLTNIQNSLDAIRGIESRVELEDCKKNICRLDIAFDSYKKYEDFRNVILILMECLARGLGAKTGIYNTREKKDIKDIKFRVKNIEISCYDCTDKPRDANIRLEIRFLNIKKSKRADGNIVRSKLKEISNLLTKSLKHFSEVEERYFTYVINKYKEQDFYTFFIENKELILTSRISQVIFDSLATQKSHKRFLEIVRSKTDLEFITKTDLILLVAELKSLINNLLIADKTSIENESFKHLLSA